MGRITTIYGEVHFCDFCGDELKPEWDYTISISDELSIGIYDYCPDCYKFLKNMLNNSEAAVRLLYRRMRYTGE